MRLLITSCLRALPLAIAALCLPAGHALAQVPAPVASVNIVAPPPIDHFFTNAVFSSADLSPNAKFLAVRFGSPKERDRLAVVDLVSNTVKIVASYADADIGDFEWVNDKRLVFSLADKRRAPGERRSGSGLFGVDRDGTNLLRLIATGSPEHSRMLNGAHFLAYPAGKQDTDEVYVYRSNEFANEERNNYGLLRLNTRTGQSVSLDRPGKTFGWQTDRNGVPRLTSVMDKNMTSFLYLDPVTNKFRTLASFDAYLGSHSGFTPLALGANDTLYVTTGDGKDKTALHTFDLKTNKLNPTPLVALENFDFTGQMMFTDEKLLGVRYLSDAYASIWFDEDMKKIQAQVDALLPATVNLINVARRAEVPWMLVSSYSDRQPLQYALFNTKTGKLNPVGESHPQIKAAQMAEQEIVRVKARDGLPIPVWMTVPNGGRKNLPMVVMVHGGPYVRGHEWGWSPNAQFLASRGYVVLEPEFRGSTGYGDKHYKAGWKQWGLSMQNDIADATRWAIAEGIADPKRICIAGASYGGYATLMGLINDPELYKCGIDIVGVTDLTLLAGRDWSFTSDLNDGYKKYGMPELIGDPVKDAARFSATSPLMQAARIKQPLLLAYGGRDVRVPLHHGKLFYDAAKAHNPNVEMIIYEDEAHGWTLPKNRIDFWSRVEKFLDQHIGKK
ncbi:MAG: alpha/beta fold hydrolase [Pseudomonadota bacterium]